MSKVDTDEPENVLLHQIPREASPKTPSTSPPCLKLETYLRMANIPYKNAYCYEMSSKGTCPWIEYKGEQVADSNFSVLFLNQTFHVDLDEHLSPVERGISHAFKTMLEENTYWTLAYDRFVVNYDETYEHMGERLPWFARFWFPRTIKNKAVDQMHGHGIGRHTQEEVYGIAERDLKSVSDFLGDKKFLMGDKPSLVDCSLFALIAIFVWQWSSTPQAVYIKKVLHNLEPYCQRMKELYYPDWDQIIKS